ncbi:adhesin [Pasteurellaceae bacterium Macca]|nr:adhesin [Pasteurellaceae bacterium Macca]
MSENTQPSVIRFEQAVKAKDHELSCRELLRILEKLDSNFGGTYEIEINYPPQLAQLEQEKTVHFCTRMANAITLLFEDPELNISESGALRFLTLQRWMSLIFASSPYVNTDHILRSYNSNDDKKSSDIILTPTKTALIKFCIMYLPESMIPINLDTIWNIDPELCASLCFSLQSPRFIGTEPSFAKRSTILQWFPEKLAQLKNLNSVPNAISHDVYMHCSYDIAANKHDVKRALNQVIRKHLVEGGWEDRQNITQIGERNGKPVMVVLLEHFHAAHSIYRTHSTSMIAARELFHLIGIGGSAVDEDGRNVFDEFIELDAGNIFTKLTSVKQICTENQAAIFYMPSIGMDLTTIFASNTRLAPIQAIALGHPATTHSDFIEYVIVEDDYVGSESCFSEKLLRLPKDALPYVPSALAPTSVEYRLRENPEVVNIGIAATTMKLNPYFLNALKAIRDRANVKVHFHFALGQSTGITHPYVERFIKSYLGNDATAHAHTPYDQYLRILYNCDMMVNPFPFGNTNGIIDMVTLGLIGVCKTGPEVHEHIDEGLFKRLGLPEWLITHSVDEYVAQAIRLAENHQERLAIRRQIIENNGLQTLFSGDPRPMGRVFFTKLQEWQQANGAPLAQNAKQAVKKGSKSAKAEKTGKAEKPAKSEKTTKAEKTVKPAKKAPAKATSKKEPSLKTAAKALKKTK